MLLKFRETIIEKMCCKRELSVWNFPSGADFYIPTEWTIIIQKTWYKCKLSDSPTKAQSMHCKDVKPAYANEHTESPYLLSVNYGARDFYISSSSPRTSKTPEKVMLTVSFFLLWNPRFKILMIQWYSTSIECMKEMTWITHTPLTEANGGKVC